MSHEPDSNAYWSVEPAALSAALRSGSSGLAHAEAAARLARTGPNDIAPGAGVEPLRLLLRQFESPLVLILVFAAVVSLGLRQWIDAAIILAIVLGSSLLGFLQEYRASNAIAALTRRLALTSRVVRDAREQRILLAHVVPGDIVLLSAGNLIPADGVVLEATDFLVNEASLTGESFPVEKRPGVTAADAPPVAQTNAVFMGSSVRSGTARVLAVHTGSRTRFGAIAARLRERPPETEFARGVRQFGALLIRVMTLIVLSVLTVNLLLERPVIESLLFAVALAVGLSPELLPAIVTVTLSAGARSMGERGVIVRRLEALENLGSMDVLCTDKTGTLTEGRSELAEALDASGRRSPEVLRLAFLNAAFETGIDNPLDSALVAAGRRLSLRTDDHRKIDEIPYDFKRRRLTIVLAPERMSGRHLFVTKGAVASVLDCCTRVDRDGESVLLDAGQREALAALFEQKSAQGLRVLALATRTLEARGDYRRDDERDMTFRGFLVFDDPPREDAASSLLALRRLGIRVKVVSGDNRHVTAHLAGAIGLDARSMLTGEQIEELKDEALWHLAPRTDLFVEIDPQQKERIVRALQRAGHCVGYLGDGINDAPALHAADIGISVESAVDVARESADIVLLRPDLDVLRCGVEDGRRAFANTLKYISITTSANFGNMVSMALAAPFLPFLPLAAKQILLNNFLSDLPSVAISSDRVDREHLLEPQRWDVREVRRFMVVFGLVSSVFDLLTFAVLLLVLKADQATFQTSWFLISLLTELAVVLVLRTHGPAWLSRPSPLLLGSTLSVLTVALALPYLGAAAGLFSFVPLPATHLALVLAILLGYVLATEATKRIYHGHRRPARAGR
ncbi:MAG: magnesium-translocating P-type ATPase [Pseudomonadota bacterium]